MTTKPDDNRLEAFIESVRGLPFPEQFRRLLREDPLGILAHETTRKITVHEVEWRVDCLPEDESPRENLDPSATDVVERIERDLEDGNEWAWCCVRVTGSFHGIEEETFLGCCSYDSRDDFVENGGHYSDMQADVIDQLQARVDRIARWIHQGTKTA